MLFYLFEYLDKAFDFPGAGVFRFISFRAAMAIITSLVISLLFGKKIIAMLHRKQVGESIRDLGLEGQKEKEGTPTMGGLIILSAILIPTLLFARIANVYIIIMLISTVWLGAIGFLDDYIKVFRKNKKGLAGKFKIAGQIGLGLIVGGILYFSDSVIVREDVILATPVIENSIANTSASIDIKSTKTTIPFLKNNEFNYEYLISALPGDQEIWLPIVFILAVILIVTAVSNGANITDGIDGLATGTSAIIGATLGIFAYVSGNTIFADYLNIMYIPNTGELLVFMSAFVGACVGFLWYNAYPAQVFMGDTGSLALGGSIAVFAISIRKELLIPIICGVFLVENLSVMMQVSYFKYTKKRFGEGRRIFKMSPLHHHFQKLGYNESKIVTRFWIVGIFLAVLSIITLKLR
ncbi:MAG TPA: phospho-N-acetylmuramoyl-pentapeptide-transferase [Bacteroidia bacterium]|nr:phospho-N-acetylmuramoyl-pentapeptide-transferase [Bacteroidia bacterium]